MMAGDHHSASFAIQRLEDEFGWGDELDAFDATNPTRSALRISRFCSPPNSFCASFLRERKQRMSYRSPITALGVLRGPACWDLPMLLDLQRFEVQGGQALYLQFISVEALPMRQIACCLSSICCEMSFGDTGAWSRSILLGEHAFWSSIESRISEDPFRFGQVRM